MTPIPSHDTESGYRSDIDGLRAIAVMAILAFHLDTDLLPGGFQGVDAFFVVSGFVITRLIRSDPDAFRFGAFYRRRFWRLFPALCATIGATLLAAYPFFTTIDYTALGQSALSALFGVSNFYFYAQSDYFNDNTLIHPLLHTWSLGVEEQFYLIWPFMLVVLARRIALPWLIVATFAASFLLNLLMAGGDAAFAFYMTPVRIFEFAAGAAALQWGARVPRRLLPLLAASGGALLASGFLFFGEGVSWPGVYSLFPVAGTAFLLIAGTHPLVTACLSFAPLRGIGRLSYALYLVHWPIIVIYSYWRAVPLAPAETAALAAASFAAAFFLHVFVELPFREGGRPFWHGIRSIDIRRWAGWARFRPGVLGLGTATTFLLAVAVSATGGMPHRIDTVIGDTASLSFAGNLCNFASSSSCQFGDTRSRRTVYVVGDSHAGNLLYGLDRFFRERGIRGVGLYDNGCLFLFGTTRFINGWKDEACARTVANAYEALGNVDAPVVLAGDYRGYVGEIGPALSGAPLDLDRSARIAYIEERMREGLEALHADRRPVLLVKLAYNSLINTARCLSRPSDAGIAYRLATDCRPMGLAENRQEAAETDAMIDRLAARYRGARSIDPKTAFCDAGTCTVVHDGAFLFLDKQHLTDQGSLYLVESWRATLADWLDSPVGKAE